MKYLPPVLAVVLAISLARSQQPPTATKPLPVQDALAAFTTPDDLAVEPVLSEPDITQPLQLSFDERGRLWVVEYRQYPFPAGLKRLGHDRFWRVVYDKVPPPPPDHFVGKDRVSIHEDTDGDGTFDKHSVFVEGLNIVSSCAKGRGGVFVLNPPYLLFYPDKNDDDKPDGPPEVLLEGFGLEDTHSVANSLRWGPDGWLYGALGSTVSGKVKRYGTKDEPVHSMGQQIWRYHPERKVYEIFAEGGGNAFGVEFDAKGRVYSGHNGGDTRGFHYVQGGYYRKGFDKHGPLANPYTFGYLNPMKSPNLKRFTHTFVVNDSVGLPAKYQGHLFAIDPLASKVVLSELTSDGSTFQTRDVGDALATTDPWFRPVDLKAGPDGALYVADFYDQHIAHLRHHEGLIDTDHGRVYRLRAKDAKPTKPTDLGKLTSAQLVEKLRDPNRTVRQTALRLLGDRKDAGVVPALRKAVRDADGQAALEALWALHQTGLDGATAVVALGHADPLVRAWAVRLVCDDGKVSPELLGSLEKLAGGEKDVEVRSQLGCSARRIAGADGLRVVRALLDADADLADPHLPLVYWWAIEAKAATQRDAVLRLFEDSALWRKKLVAGFVAERLMRRYAQAGSQADLRSCARLLRLAPEEAYAKALLAGFEAGTSGRALANLPRELVDALAARGGGSLTLRLRQGQPAAIDEALKTLQEAKAPAKDRAALAGLLGELQEKRAVPVLLGLLDTAKEADLLQAALTALQAFPDEAVATKILGRYKDFAPAVREVAEGVLVARPAWGFALLQAVEAGSIPAKSLSDDAVRRLTFHKDARLATLVKKHFGGVEGATTEAMRAEIDRLAKVVRSERGDPAAGKKLYGQHCGKCHQLFGEGGQIGPDLTTFRRTDIDLMLLHVVNPSAEIREGFETTVIETADGRVLQGFLVDRDDQVVVLRGADGQTQVIAKAKVEEMNVVRRSIMPENALREFGEQQVRDLFAYLRSSQPLQVPDK